MARVDFRKWAKISYQRVRRRKYSSTGRLSLKTGKKEVFINRPVVFQGGCVRSLRDYLVERHLTVEDERELALRALFGSPLHHVCNC